MSKKIEKQYSCPECASRDVRAERWVGVNDESVMSDWTGVYQCANCDFETSHFEDFPLIDPPPVCGHSACRQNWIENAEGACVS